ncbi:Choline transport protein [Beauveria bassiana D1-5]|uniref:Choline transport protein n=1 Tax=Beauveria bassiana D1-5 TaxID=1245745 RepID=A0A0A2VY48_BEABA|nr:Choline transport protein [Beauveria bassiana D1-5]
MSSVTKPSEPFLAHSDTAPATETPTIEKRFNFWTAFGVAVCTSGAWEGWTASIAQGLAGGGPVCLLWGWVVVSVGIICMSSPSPTVVDENVACSMWPSAGGQYVWAANLAPVKYSRVLSWTTAWLGVAGLWLGALSCGMGVAVQIQSYAIVSTEYEPKTWHAFMICIACMVCWAVVNIFAVQLLHYMNAAIHVVGYLLVIGVLAGSTKEKHDATFVFTKFQNSTGWDSDFVSWSVGLLSALYAYFSLDTAAHFSEEIPRANVLVPRAMVLQAVATALMTLPFIITVLFCIGDIGEVLASPIGTMSPFTQILINSTSNVGLSCFLNCISSSVAMAAGFDLWGAASRAIWSMARDKALPATLAKLHPRWNVPVLANLVLLLPSIVIFMIYIWNTTAFYGIMAGVLVSFQLSYVVPLGINIFYTTWWKRELTKGPFAMGRFSFPVHVVAFLFGCYMVLFISFPVNHPVTAANMNYGSAIIGAISILAIMLWIFYGRKYYYGPLQFTATEAEQTESIASKAEHTRTAKLGQP